MSILSLVRKWSLNVVPHPEIPLLKESRLIWLDFQMSDQVKSHLGREVMTMHSLQQSQLDTEMEERGFKIFPTDSIIWLNIWSYFKGSFPGDFLYKFKKINLKH